jgi:hypothetical protein
VYVPGSDGLITPLTVATMVRFAALPVRRELNVALTIRFAESTVTTGAGLTAVPPWVIDIVVPGGTTAFAGNLKTISQAVSLELLTAVPLYCADWFT